MNCENVATQIQNTLHLPCYRIRSVYSILFTILNTIVLDMCMIVRMMCLPTILDLHDSSPIPTISMVDDMLDPAIRKSHSVLSLHTPTLISRPLLTEVCVVLVIVHSVLKVEGIRPLVINIPSMTSMAYNSIRGW